MVDCAICKKKGAEGFNLLVEGAVHDACVQTHLRRMSLGEYIRAKKVGKISGFLESCPLRLKCKEYFETEEPTDETWGPNCKHTTVCRGLLSEDKGG